MINKALHQIDNNNQNDCFDKTKIFSPAVDLLRKEFLDSRLDMNGFSRAMESEHLPELFVSNMPDSNDEKPKEDVTIPESQFHRLSPVAQEVLKRLKVESISVFSQKGKEYLSIEFKKDGVTSVEDVDFGDGKKLQLTKRGNGKREMTLPEGQGAIYINPNLTAEVVRDQRGVVELKHLKGVSAKVNTDFGKFDVSLEKLSIVKNDGEMAQLEITADTPLKKETVSLDFDSNKIADFNFLIADIDKLRMRPDKTLVLKVEAKKQTESESNILDYVLGGSLLALGAYGLKRLIQRSWRPADQPSSPPAPAEIVQPSQPTVRHPIVAGRVLQPGTELAITASGELTNQKNAIRVATLQVDQNGELKIKSETGGPKNIFLRRANGKIEKVNVPGDGVSIKPGEAFTFGQLQFMEVSAPEVSSLMVKFVNSNGPNKPEIKVAFEKGQTLEVGGAMNTPALRKTDTATARINLPHFKVSISQSTFGFDEGGLFVTDGTKTIDGHTIHSVGGTHVNGKKLKGEERVYLKAGDKVQFGNPDGHPSTVIIEANTAQNGATGILLADSARAEKKVRFIEASEGKSKTLDVVPDQIITIGKKGDLDVGGTFITDKHADLCINAKGEAFIKILASTGTGQKGTIIKASGEVVPLTAQDGWVPLEKTDSITLGGSKPFRLGEKINPDIAFEVAGQSTKLAPGEEIYLGRSVDKPGARVINFSQSHISRSHAKIGADESGHLYIMEEPGPEGEGTKNGTFVNNIRLTPGVRYFVKKGDIIILGDKQADDAVQIRVKNPQGIGRPSQHRGIPLDNANGKPLKDQPEQLYQIGAEKVEIKDAVIPSNFEKRNPKTVGELNGRKILMVGQLGKDLPHEAVPMTEKDFSALLRGNHPKYEKVTLTIFNEKYIYYREKTEGTSRFYQMSDGKPPSLMRDYDIFFEPQGNNGAKLVPPVDGNGDNGTKDNNGGKPNTADGAKPGTGTKPGSEAINKLAIPSASNGEPIPEVKPGRINSAVPANPATAMKPTTSTTRPEANNSSSTKPKTEAPGSTPNRITDTTLRKKMFDIQKARGRLSILAGFALLAKEALEHLPQGNDP